MAKPHKPKDIDGYIAQVPAEVQALLEKVRTTIRHAAPEARETMSYLMPAFKLHGIRAADQPADPRPAGR